MKKSEFNKLVNKFGSEKVIITKNAPKAVKKFGK